MSKLWGVRRASAQSSIVTHTCQPEKSETFRRASSRAIQTQSSGSLEDLGKASRGTKVHESGRLRKPLKRGPKCSLRLDICFDCKDGYIHLIVNWHIFECLATEDLKRCKGFTVLKRIELFSRRTNLQEAQKRAIEGRRYRGHSVNWGKFVSFTAKLHLGVPVGAVMTMRRVADENENGMFHKSPVYCRTMRSIVKSIDLDKLFSEPVIQWAKLVIPMT